MADSKRESEEFWRRLEGRLAENPPDLPEEMRNLLEAVASAGDSGEGPTLPHDELRAWIPSYVQAEIGGLDLARLYPEVHRHLELCGDCLEEYLDLLQLALAEEAGMLPAIANAPVPNLSFVATGNTGTLLSDSLAAFVRSLAEGFFRERAPKLVDELNRIADTFFVQVRELGGHVGPESSRMLELDDSQPEGEQPFEVFGILAAIYWTTQSLVESLSIGEIDVQAASGQLTVTARVVAQRVVFGMELDPVWARQFPDGYAGLVARRPAELKAVIRSLHP